MNHSKTDRPGLNAVRVYQQRVTPLGFWNSQLRDNYPHLTSWPRSSDKLCWWCCHTFDHVPALLPITVGLKERSFIMTGNFCSWNCVREYVLKGELTRRGYKGACWIGLLAFLTVYKPQHCLSVTVHNIGLCTCTNKYRGILPALPREKLIRFGGSMSIEEYRNDFLIISDYEWVEQNIMDGETAARVLGEAQRLRDNRSWGLRYLEPVDITMNQETYVNILPISNKTFNRDNMISTGTDEDLCMRTQNKKRAAKTPQAQAETTVVPMETCTSTSSTSTKRQPFRTCTRKTSQARSAAVTATGSLQPQPTPLPLSSTPSAPSQPRAAPQRVMSADNVLACNEEQSYYTNSLRQYGNLMTSMGIRVSRPS